MNFLSVLLSIFSGSSRFQPNADRDGSAIDGYNGDDDDGGNDGNHSNDNGHELFDSDGDDHDDGPCHAGGNTTGTESYTA